MNSLEEFKEEATYLLDQIKEARTLAWRDSLFDKLYILVEQYVEKS